MADEALKTDNGLIISPADLHWEFVTSSKPGGQHANRAATKVRVSLATDAVRGPANLCAQLRHRLGPVISVNSSEHRSQYLNKEACIKKLLRRVESASQIQTPRQKTAPSRASRSLRLEAKHRQSLQKRLRRRPETNEN